MLEHGLPHIMPMPEPFDGYVENPARASTTCLVAVARNRYAVPCERATQRVVDHVCTTVELECRQSTPSMLTVRRTGLAAGAA